MRPCHSKLARWKFNFVSFLQLRYMICGVDFTVNPANAQLVTSSLQVLANMLAMGSCNVGHVQMPMFHKQTNSTTILKHRRSIEDALLRHLLSVDKPVVLLFDRHPEYRGNNPSTHQGAAVVTHSQFSSSSAFNECKAVQEGRIGPIPLARVSDFIDYDESCRPGPAERVEQKLLCISFLILLLTEIAVAACTLTFGAFGPAFVYKLISR